MEVEFEFTKIVAIEEDQGARYFVLGGLEDVCNIEWTIHWYKCC